MTGFDARSSATTFGAAILMLIGTGCATKKHVRQVVAPVEARVGQAEAKNAEQQAAIGELGNSVSRADERAQDADRKATEAGQAAQKAGQSAQAAQSRADQSYSLAETGKNVAESTRARLGQVTENIDNYKLTTSENILFASGRATLTKQSKEQLDNAVSQLQNAKNYVLEIQGFTDSTGGAAMNLDLSRRRADAVVRYLTVQHNVPLRKINVLGIGEDDPNADNKTREGRKQARRVEIRVFTLDLGGQGQTSGAANVPQSGSNVARHQPAQ
jgi:outer membrane protein OmpA-like peptidoglycan-associated protein